MAELDHQQQLARESKERRAAAAERLGEDPSVVVLSRSDEQIAKEQSELDQIERS